MTRKMAQLFDFSAALWLVALDVAVTCREDEWLYAFMGYGNATQGDACTFTCPPGHRVVGYVGGLVPFFGFIKYIRFLTAPF